MNEIEQVEENVRIASEAKADSLSKEELEVFEQVKQEINKKIKVPCTGCAYCMPCPQGVDIPGCFSAYNMRYTDGWYAGFKTYFMCTTLRKNQTNASKCVGCGKCAEACPFGLIVVTEGNPASKCIACGICAKACPMDVLEVVEE